jgi:multiple sugar transport system substrate-binding protein
MDLTRRQLFSAAGALALPAVLAGCGGGFSTSGGTQAPGTDSVAFTTWGTDAELAGFRTLISGFEKANPGKTVQLNSVPYGQMFSTIDAQLQAGNPPDVFRVPYYTFGSYAGRGQLLDLSTQLPAGFADRFTPAAWAAVQGKGSPFGVPHHTDTSVIFYDKAALSKAGVTSVPTSLDQAWSWDELAGVADKLRASLPDSAFPFAYNWQGNGVTRWLTWLFEADGRFLTQALDGPAISSPAALDAVTFTQSFFAKKYVPPNASVKSTTYAADLWYSGTAAMVWGGAFMVPDADKTAKGEWGVTFAPRKNRAASDFGGNALVVTAKSKNPALATAFLDYATTETQMRAFCETASLLPTRADLVTNGITLAVRPELSPVFVGQASTVRAEDSGQVASPAMSKIIPVLKDSLEQAFVGGGSAADAVAAMAAGIARAVTG